MKKRVLGLIRDESGATAVEYGLIAAMIALAVVGGMGSITEALQAILEKIAAANTGLNPSQGPPARATANPERQVSAPGLGRDEWTDHG